jgi:two-component sensor histidine kinase
MIYTLIIGVSTALFYQARKAMSKVEEQLMATTAEASWQITRIRQKHRELEHSLANQLHGKVQGALSATYLKLANALKQDDVSAGSLTEYRENLVENILSLGEAGSRPFKLDEAVDETARTWENVCEVQVHVEDQLRELIYTDSLLCHALEDLLPELAFNAVKHGRAKHLDIHIELTTERTIRLTAQDDGSEISPSERMGIGSKLLDECCIGWTRSSNERGTTVVAELPLNRTDLQP